MDLSVAADPTRIPTPVSPAQRRGWTRLWELRRPGWLEAGFLVLLLLSLGMRLWELGGRTMHYDEAIHVHFSWQLANGQEYLHSPWMHGPFQIEFTALILRIFGDTDFTSRLGYALFGVALVALPYFLREHLGRAGSLLAGVMLSFSPALLYFSRFGRNDIIMAFWATALLILMWRYIHEGKDRYLYLASAVLAFMFATKETAYIIVIIFGGILFLLALPDLIPWALRRHSLSRFTGPAGFFLLLATLTLPQWSAAVGFLQGPLGLQLVNPNGVATGLVGAPQWAAPFLVLPVYLAPWWLHAVTLALAGGVLYFLRRPQGGPERDSLLTGMVTPLLAAIATILWAFRPLGDPASLALAAILIVIAVAVPIALRKPWRSGSLLIIAPILSTLLYLALFTSVVNVGPQLNAILPDSIQVDASTNGIPLNFLVAAGVLATLLLVSLYFGMRWRGGVWLACAAIFYLIWVTLYTTLFNNWAGIFSGIWQGMGYWIAQQEVARGNQPWYYYLVGLSVYELLPVIFGALGAAYYLKRGDILGLILAVWAGLTLLAYTIATEKMPWLLVNVTLPFILLAGKYLGDLAERVPWGAVLRRGSAALLVLPPAIVVLGVYFLIRYLDLANPLSESPESAGLPGFQLSLLLIILTIAALAMATAYLIRLATPDRGLALAGLGIAALLLGFGAWGALRAAYTYDDSNVEILVYAQGSQDLRGAFDSLDERVFQQPESAGAVTVDYDLWYPFQWYVRHQQKSGVLRFQCFKSEDEADWTADCSPTPHPPDPRAVLLTGSHASHDLETFTPEQREGPLRNLLWFPETYRRPGENRQAEAMPAQLAEDFKFFGEITTSKPAWHKAIRYLIFRDLESDWFSSDFYSYLP